MSEFEKLCRVARYCLLFFTGFFIVNFLCGVFLALL